MHVSADSLSRSYSNCLALLTKAEKNFTDLSQRHPADFVRKWELLDTAPTQVNGVWSSVYEVRFQNGEQAVPSIDYPTIMHTLSRPTHAGESIQEARSGGENI